MMTVSLTQPRRSGWATLIGWTLSLALLAPATATAQARVEAHCADPVSAEAAYSRCQTLSRAGRCQEARRACRAASAACATVAKYSQSVALVASACRPDPLRERVGPGARCQRDEQCRRGLSCERNACRAAPQARVRVRELQIHARLAAAWSPCDARAILEMACGVARDTEHTDLSDALKPELAIARQRCATYNGEICGRRWDLDADMVDVPASTFERGSDDDGIQFGLTLCRDTYTSGEQCTEDWFMREHPRTQVTLKTFSIDRTEVTNAQFDACVAEGGCTRVLYESCVIHDPSTGTWSEGGPGPDALRAPDHPVVCVTWAQARDYCAWAGKRLPTEAEWEKAARGDRDDREFPWGSQWHDDWLNWGELDGFGAQDGYETSAPVASFPKNVSPYGAFDMAGNVWEWTEDRYQSDYYAQSPTQDPLNKVQGDMRVMRGGSWSFAGNGARVSYRYYNAPDTRDDAIGFRCARSAQ